jgi:hypothetical protein
MESKSPNTNGETASQRRLRSQRDVCNVGRDGSETWQPGETGIYPDCEVDGDTYWEYATLATGCGNQRNPKGM